MYVTNSLTNSMSKCISQDSANHKINKWGVLKRSGCVGKNRKINTRGRAFIWHPRVGDISLDNFWEQIEVTKLSGHASFASLICGG